MNFIKELDSQAKGQSPVKEMIEKLEQDPDYAIHLKQATMSAKSAAPTVAPVAPGGALKQVPCPACKLPIMDYAAICPHCNVKIRAVGTFANMDTGPKVEWQEVAYTIMSSIIIGLSALGVFLTLPAAQKGGFQDFSTVAFVASCFQGLIGLGLLFRQEWIGYIAKIFLFLRVALNLPFFAVYLMAGRWIGAGSALIELAVAGFMIYLINYVIGD